MVLSAFLATFTPAYNTKDRGISSHNTHLTIKNDNFKYIKNQ